MQFFDTVRVTQKGPICQNHSKVEHVQASDGLKSCIGQSHTPNAQTVKALAKLCGFDEYSLIRAC